jgi:AP2 domain
MSFWEASWEDNGKSYCRRFHISRCGEREAKRLARKVRKNAESRISDVEAQQVKLGNF